MGKKKPTLRLALLQTQALDANLKGLAHQFIGLTVLANNPTQEVTRDGQAVTRVSPTPVGDHFNLELISALVVGFHGHNVVNELAHFGCSLHALQIAVTEF